MSKINAIRIVNLNYNDNTFKIEDELYELGGNTTLFSLDNGGGKSVLVQMLLAPYVHTRYRNMTDRSFESFFTTTRPTHVMVEWQLENHAGYVLVGMMVRKSSTNEDTENSLEITTYVYDYLENNVYDIHSIPIVDVEGKKRTMKGYGQCKALLETIRQEMGIHFRSYDLMSPSSQRQYFEHLKQYGIDAKEWESIIRKVNLEESGLSDLFKQSKDEAGLVEKWILPTIQDKLNQDQDRIKHFQEMLKKYIIQYKQNENKLSRRDTILVFEEDTKGLLEQANEYWQSAVKKTEIENKIAYLIKCLKQKIDDLSGQKIELETKMSECDERINTILYQQASYEIYLCMEELDSLFEQRGSVEVALQENFQLIIQTEKEQHVQECAREFAEQKTYDLEVKKLESQLRTAKLEEEDKLPERNNLGYQLNVYYSEQYKKVCEEEQKVEHELEDSKVQRSDLEKSRETGRQKEVDLEKSLTALQGQIEGYDDSESQFNTKYGESLARNILGVYENETFGLLKQRVEHDNTLIEDSLHKTQNELPNVERELKREEKELGESQELAGRLQVEQEAAEKELDELKDKAEKVKGVLGYISFHEDKSYEKEMILKAFADKIEQTETVRNRQQKKKDDLVKEKTNLESGKLLELPEEVERFFNEQGIAYIYGMTYLKQHKDALKSCPVLPYSIVLSEREVERLKQVQIPFYTAYPIPIVVRETLMSGAMTDQTVELFYSFNEHLLDEEALEQLINDKQREIEEMTLSLEKVIDELALLRDKQGIVLYYYVSALQLEEAESIYEEKCKACEETAKCIVDHTNRCEEHKAYKHDLQQQLLRLEKEFERGKALCADVLALMDLYEAYEKNCRHKVEMKKQLGTQKDKLKELEQQVKAHLEQEDVWKEQHSQLRIEKKTNQEKQLQFAQYENGKLSDCDIDEVIARYEAITSQVQGKISDLEQRLVNERLRFHNKQQLVEQRAAIYDLSVSEYQNVMVDSYKETQLGKKIKELNKEKESLTKSFNEIEIKIGIRQGEEKQQRERLKKKFKKEELASKEELVNLDFEVQKVKVEDRQRLLKKSLSEVEQLLGNYAAQNTALAQYEGFHTSNEFDFADELKLFGKDDLFDLNRNEFNHFQGSMLHEYDEIKNILIEKEKLLSNEIRELRNRPCYEEDFFRKPLLSLQEMSAYPERLYEQLQINLESFQKQLDKLEVDIAFIGEEKQKLMELLYDYIVDVHENLGQIDRNSTITFRDKSLKMLQIALLDIENQDELNMLKLKDFVDALTKQALLRLDNNENIEELIGNRVTTKELYDTVIGIATIRIHLYKIEKETEKRITWAQVCKNSGGEGFLSAFVVLSSLMSYMRRDDTDILRRNEEGKVLVMDNPFAQTNAEHLLVPLMELAKRSNTQLICLSGLGGENIYNCFDNIYILQLESSELNQKSYLTSKQIKGDVKIYEMKSSQVKVENPQQMELIF